MAVCRTFRELVSSVDQPDLRAFLLDLSSLVTELSIPRMRGAKNRRRFNTRLRASGVIHGCEWNLFKLGLPRGTSKR